mmetsp:Transcript_27452/g.65101  ORF Transcript_27452/g.65101 Transcript_27452/m.65101 type:complete len:509 (-) Transcript_27452:32-1558(-)
MGLTRSLDAFQQEWYEKLQTGELREDSIGTVPDIYLRNQELDNAVLALRAELDKAKEIAHKARSTWDKFRKERDFHRMHHRRVAQEKNSLLKDLRRLRAHLQNYEPTLKGLEHKYQLAMKEKAIAKMQQDRTQARVDTLEAQLRHLQSAAQVQRGEMGLDTTPQQETPAVATVKKELKSTKRPSAKAVATKKDAELPPDERPNPYLSLALEKTQLDKFQMRKNYPAHIAPVSALAMHPKKPIVATASDDTTWKMWALPSGDLIMSGEGHKEWVSDIAFHPHGVNLATSSGDATVKVWDFAKAQCVQTFTEHAQAVWGVSYHDTGDILASCSMDHTTKLWDLCSQRCRLTLRGHVDSVNACVFQPFSNNICTCSGDKTVSLWDARGGLCVQTFYGHLNSCNHAAFSLTGDVIASTDADGGVKLWDIRMVQQRVEMNAGPHPANKCVFDRSGELLAVASEDGEIKIFNTSDGALLTCLTGHEEAVLSVEVDKGGKFLVSGGADNTFRLWS